MALPKQTVSLFFGATDQDTSAKAAKLGDLTLAENVRQVKGGEWSKRDGFTQTAQTYEGQANLVPDSVVSPDGVQVLARDAATDHVFSRGASISSNRDKGHAARFVPKVETRFPAPGSGKHIAPMAKQCGSYMAWLEDPRYFRVAELNPSETAATGSPTRTADTVVRQSAAIDVNLASSGASSTVRSFALVDFSSFDADNLWLLWVDQTNKIFSLKIPHTNLNSSTFHTVYTATEDATHKKFFTSITATCIEGGLLAVAACGVGIDTAANYLSPGVGGTAATGFRTAGAGQSNYGCTIAVHGHLSKTTAEFTSSSELATPYGRQVAAACTMATAYGFQGSNDYWFYVFFGVTTKPGGGDNQPGIVVVRVATADCSYATYDTNVTIATPDDYGRPSDWSDSRWAMFGWFYNAQIAAKETTTGVAVALTVIPYYVTGDGVFKAWNPDYLTVQYRTLVTATATWTYSWQKLGACVAQGCIRQQDHSQVTPTEGANYLLTLWEDKEALQTCYHVREWDTGDIVGQIAYGRGAHIGHTGIRDEQALRYISDVQQPMLSSWRVHAEYPSAIIIGLLSENQNSSVDVAEFILWDWDYSTGAKPVWQNAFESRGLAFAPGPIPTVFNGFQSLREAGPLVYPSRPETFLGVTSS